MRLFLYELKKLLLTEKGLWILLGAALLSAALMFFFPEQRDARIVHAHKKYDEYMSRYYGPDTEEKQTEIRTRAEEVLSILGSFVENRTAYQNGKMTEAEGWAYIRAYAVGLRRIVNFEKDLAELFVGYHGWVVLNENGFDIEPFVGLHLLICRRHVNIVGIRCGFVSAECADYSRGLVHLVLHSPKAPCGKHGVTGFPLGVSNYY